MEDVGVFLLLLAAWLSYERRFSLLGDDDAWIRGVEYSRYDRRV